MNKKYIKPAIVQVKIDTEIALILNSNPPIGPDEEFGQSQLGKTVFKA